MIKLDREKVKEAVNTVIVLLALVYVGAQVPSAVRFWTPKVKTALSQGTESVKQAYKDNFKCKEVPQ